MHLTSLCLVLPSVVQGLCLQTEKCAWKSFTNKLQPAGNKPSAGDSTRRAVLSLRKNKNKTNKNPEQTTKHHKLDHSLSPCMETGFTADYASAAGTKAW